ncbi:DNA polymerase iota isoform X2 [Corythoichthys intestinalis]|nr:DNA polymerase iota isoform X2 [Corythoichthys intestinalis]XP_057687623.1 DNA polymerase iota isoform X2 [Corythoichthys intestinalis]
MSVTDAKEKCPQLVLVKGEDLTHYREMSYQVTDLLLSFCPLVERLGFDENFVDVTEMVQKQMPHTPHLSFKGHVYGTSNEAAESKASDHSEFALGSHIAAELREAIRSQLGLTGCAGVAGSKLLAKLVSGTFKPNQQTTLLPENISDIMGSLSSLRKVPGIGHQTAKRLQTLGLLNIKDLQLFPSTVLAKEFGSPCAIRLKNLSLGLDDSPVRPAGAPQSLSDEDSFKKMSCVKEVTDKIQQLLSSLLERMRKDGRQPRTFRLSVRKYSASNKWCSRESRQCPIPNHVGHEITSASNDDTLAQLLSLAMKLFSKMVDMAAPFHLTLISVCFSNLQIQAPTRGAITSFFAPAASPLKTQSQINSKNGGGTDDEFHSPPQARLKQSACSVLEAASHPATSSGGDADISATHRLPSSVDPQVFSQLPANLQMELMSEWEQQRPLLKITAASKKTKDKKSTGRGSQANSLLNYFKPM